MTKLELKEWITELACSLDRGDLKIDELMNEVEEVVDKNVTEQLTLTDVVSSCVDRKTLIEDLDDKRIIGTLVDKDGWYYCRKETAQHLLDKYEMKHK